MTKIATKIHKATELEVRRAKLAQLVMDGEVNQVKLGKLVTLPGQKQVSAKTISLDMKALRAEWSKLRVRCFDTDFGREYQRLEREYSRWLRAWKRSCKRKRYVKRKYETHMTQPGQAAEPEVLADDGTVIREAVPEKDAVYDRVEVEVEVRYEESDGDARYAALVAKTSESIRDLLGLINSKKDLANTQAPINGFIIMPPAGYIPRGMVPIENQVIESTLTSESTSTEQPNAASTS